MSAIVAAQATTETKSAMATIDTVNTAVDVSILIVSYNTREMTLACLRSVYEQTHGISFDVLVVDNDSHDGSAEAIAEQFPQARLIRPGKNIGFAAANNLAARQATGEYLLLLNPDTVILDGAIQKVLAFAKTHPEAGIVGGRTFFGDGSLNYNSCHGRPTPWSLLCMGLGLSSLFRRSRFFNPESLGAWKRDSVKAVDAVTGCFLLIRRDLWMHLEGFDESFFMYGEETDLCWRAREQGYKCLIDAEAKLIHYGGASEKVRADKMIRLFRAKTHLFQKHWNQHMVWFGVRMLDLWAFSRMVVLSVLRRIQPSRAEAYQAWQEIWRRRREFHITPE
ncbi:MAG TPA: glycosyltransferase family 2 protein [Tepidisphaeraceae bacterium]|nr:glycosyltransferase family 2 protein [Tepidisphaeraceae bacterium]